MKESSSDRRAPVAHIAEKVYSTVAPTERYQNTVHHCFGYRRRGPAQYYPGGHNVMADRCTVQYIFICVYEIHNTRLELVCCCARSVPAAPCFY